MREMPQARHTGILHVRGMPREGAREGAGAIRLWRVGEGSPGSSAGNNFTMKRKPIVGETLYDLNTGNAARNCEQKLTPVVVSMVGRKFFQCHPPGKEWDKTSYHIETWREKTNYSSRHALYESKQEWDDRKEAAEIYARLRIVFSCLGAPNIPLAKLKAVEAILANQPSQP